MCWIVPEPWEDIRPPAGLVGVVEIGAAVCREDEDGGLRLGSVSMDCRRLGRVETEEVAIIVLSVEMETSGEVWWLMESCVLRPSSPPA